MTSGIPVIRAIPDLRAQVRSWRGRGESVALIPTMGALHEGNLQLVRLARSRAKRAHHSLIDPKGGDHGPNQCHPTSPRAGS